VLLVLLVNYINSLLCALKCIAVYPCVFGL